MIALHTQIIKKNGKEEYVVLPYEEFLKVQEALEDYEDLCCLREAKAAEKDAPTISLAEVKKQLAKQPASIKRCCSKESGRQRSKSTK